MALVVVLVVLSVPTLVADHLTSDCPLTLVGSTAPATDFALSPHGVFRNGSLVHVLRGQVLTTYTVNDIGELQVAREDFIGSMAAREDDGAVLFRNGTLYVSSEAGLEIYDLSNVRVGGSAPRLVSRNAGFHYRRMAMDGNIIAGLYPATDMPCEANGTTRCFNTIELIDVSNPRTPMRVGSVTSLNSSLILGFNDVAFNYGFLVGLGRNAAIVYNVSNPGIPSTVNILGYGGKFLVSNGANLLGIGNDLSIVTFGVQTNGVASPISTYNAPLYLTIERSNEIRFHNQAWFDDSNGRLITLVEEVDPQTGDAARTIAFDVFDFTVPYYEGSAERIYEDLSFTSTDEVKYNPVAVGPYIYTVGEMSGLQTWGACGQLTGRVELDTPLQLSCGGAEIHGWVTGNQKIANVEVFLDSSALGAATISGATRPDIMSKTPAQTWRINVNLDATTRGEHVLRAVGTDALGNRRQFASQRIFFPGPGQNCVNRRRAVTAR
ncbi:MAG TPA: hypothetical protein VFN10_02325 [Thermoanaerobaculia bacterium]|nr:hypothetical protein [Thermoanaerobaculia bacterium]